MTSHLLPRSDIFLAHDLLPAASSTVSPMTLSVLASINWIVAPRTGLRMTVPKSSPLQLARGGTHSYRTLPETTTKGGGSSTVTTTESVSLAIHDSQSRMWEHQAHGEAPEVM